MGFRDIFRSDEWKRTEKAADQLYAAILGGAAIRMPQTLSKEDPAIRAILRVREKYADTTAIMLQRGDMVLTYKSAAQTRVSKEAWGTLDAHGYFPDNRLPGELLLDAHAHFIRRNDTGHPDAPDVVKAAADAAVAQQKASNAIVIQG